MIGMILFIVALFVLTCVTYKWVTGQSVFRKRPKWNQQEELVLEMQTFNTLYNRDVTFSDYEAQPFALDVPKEAA